MSTGPPWQLFLVRIVQSVAVNVLVLNVQRACAKISSQKVYTPGSSRDLNSGPPAHSRRHCLPSDSVYPKQES